MKRKDRNDKENIFRKLRSLAAVSLLVLSLPAASGCVKKEISDIRYFYVSESNGMSMFYEEYVLNYQDGKYYAHIDEDHGMIDDDEPAERTVQTDAVFAAELAAVLNRYSASGWDGFGEKKKGIRGFFSNMLEPMVTDSTNYSFACETADGRAYAFQSYHKRPEGFDSAMEEIEKLFHTLNGKAVIPDPEKETEETEKEPEPTPPEEPESSEAETEPEESFETAEAPASESASEPASEPLHLTREEYPKVDGATAMYPMSVEIAKAVIGMSDEEAEAFIVHNTTSKAYDNLIDGTCDLIFVSEPSDDILKRADEAGVHFEMVGIGRDGFVFVVNQENPVDSLTIDEIRAIYTGKITNWSEVGGEDREILAYQREANSGSQNLMEKMVMKGEEMAEAPAEFVIVSMSGLIDSVASYENSRSALGYSIYLYAKDQYVKDSIKFLSIDGVYPTDESIADGSYPLSKIVYAVFRDSEPEDSTVRKLVEWLRTPEGQKPVEAGGYVGLKEE